MCVWVWACVGLGVGMYVCVGVGMCRLGEEYVYGHVCVWVSGGGEVGKTDIFSAVVICIMDFFSSPMSVYYYQFKCF